MCIVYIFLLRVHVSGKLFLYNSVKKCICNGEITYVIHTEFHSCNKNITIQIYCNLIDLLKKRPLPLKCHFEIIKIIYLALDDFTIHAKTDGIKARKVIASHSIATWSVVYAIRDLKC